MGKIKKSAYSKFEDERSVVKSILPKVDGKIRIRRILMILLYIAYVAVWLILGIMLRLVAPLMALMLVTECILIFFTWRYTKIEYELTIHEGNLGFAVIYGGLSRKELFSCRVHDLKIIAPYEGAGRRRPMRMRRIRSWRMFRTSIPSTITTPFMSRSRAKKPC